MILSALFSFGLSAQLAFGGMVCPKLDEDAVGACAEFCSGDGDCADSELCCSNGCGHECKPAVEAVCPKPEGVGLCAEFCSDDVDCGDGEMCCSNGCGRQCTAAVAKKGGGRGGVKSVKGEDKREKPKGKKPAKRNPRCPSTEGMVGLCAEMCLDNSSCEDGQICCSTGCGRACTDPVEREDSEDSLDGKPGKPDRGDKREKGDDKREKGDREGKKGGKGGKRGDGGFVCPSTDGQVGVCAELCAADTECEDGERCCSNGCGRQCMKAVKKEKPSKKPEMCPASMKQLCRRKCPEVTCGEDECLQRNNSCCDLTCEKKPEKPAEEPETCEWESSVCDPENDQCGEGKECDPKACVPSLCNCEIIKGKPSFLCTMDCNPGCVEKKPTSDSGSAAPEPEPTSNSGSSAPEPEPTSDSGSSAPEPEPTSNSGSSAPEPEPTSNSGSSAPEPEPTSNSGSSAPEPEPTSNSGSSAPEPEPTSNSGSSAPEPEPTSNSGTSAPEPATCNEDGHCGFLGRCDGGRCAVKTEVSFADVQFDCASVHGDEECKETGCGKKADEDGKCVPSSASKISCKSVGSNEAFCGALKCRFKKGKCGGRSDL